MPRRDWQREFAAIVRSNWTAIEVLALYELSTWLGLHIDKQRGR